MLRSLIDETAGLRPRYRMVMGRSTTGVIAALTGVWVVVVLSAQSTAVIGGQVEPQQPVQAVSQTAVPASTSNPQPAQSAPHQTTVRRYCVSCHNQRLKTAGLMLDGLDAEHPSADAAPG